MKIKVSFEKIVIACLIVFATGIYLLLIWAIKAILGVFGIDGETISLLGGAFFVPFLFFSFGIFLGWLLELGFKNRYPMDEPIKMSKKTLIKGFFKTLVNED